MPATPLLGEGPTQVPDAGGCISPASIQVPGISIRGHWHEIRGIGRHPDGHEAGLDSNVPLCMFEAGDKGDAEGALDLVVSHMPTMTFSSTTCFQEW